MASGGGQRRSAKEPLSGTGRGAIAVVLVASMLAPELSVAVAQDAPPPATPGEDPYRTAPADTPAQPPPAAQQPAQPPPPDPGAVPPPPPTYGGGYGGGYGGYGGTYGGYGGYGGGGYGYPPGYGYPGYPTPAYGPIRREISYEEGMPIPAGARVVERDRPGLWLTGAIIFGSLYLIGGLAASSEGSSSDLQTLWIPLLGPWLTLSSVDERERPSLVLDGIGQAVGVALVILGLAWKRKVLVIDATVGRQALRVEPTTFGGRGLGLGVSLM